MPGRARTTAADVQPAPRRSPAARLGGSGLGERLAGFIYGTIVALSVIVGGVQDYSHEPGHIAGLVAVTSTVFWIAHVYAHGLGQSVAFGKHLSFAELRHIGRREGSILEAAVPPVGALLLGGVGILPARAAVWLAFGLGLVVLGAQGVVFSRVEGVRTLGTVLVVTSNIALGLLLVALKLLLGH